MSKAGDKQRMQQDKDKLGARRQEVSCIMKEGGKARERHKGGEEAGWGLSAHAHQHVCNAVSIA